MGLLLFHLSLFGESASHFERALAINPDQEESSLHLATCRYLEGAFQTALDLSNAVRRRDPSAWAFYMIALAEIQLGRLDDAERTTDIAARQFPGVVLLYPLRGLTAALRGDVTAALAQVDLTVRNSKSFGHYHHAQYDVACIYAVLGRTDEALRWLTDAARNGFPCHSFFERDSLLESVRRDARFAPLMHDLREECAGYRELYDALQTSPNALIIGDGVAPSAVN